MRMEKDTSSVSAGSCDENDQEINQKTFEKQDSPIIRDLD